MLGEMNEKLEKCQHALLHNLEQRRIAFPRFFFLPLQDTLKIVCYGKKQSGTEIIYILYKKHYIENKEL